MNTIRLTLLALFLGLPPILFALLGLFPAQQPPLILSLNQSAFALFLGQHAPLVLPLDQTALAQAAPSYVNGSWECRYDSRSDLTYCPAECPSGAIRCESPNLFVGHNCEGNRPNCIEWINSRGGQIDAPICGVGFASSNECILSRQAPPDPPDPPVTTTPRPTTPTSGGGGGGGSSGGGAVLAGGAALLVFHFANHWTDNWSQEFLPEGLEVKPRGNVVYRDGWSGAFAGLTATYGDWTMHASSRHTGEGWSGPDARLDWRALDYAGWVVNASGSYSGGQWAKPYAKVEWSWRF